MPCHPVVQVSSMNRISPSEVMQQVLASRAITGSWVAALAVRAALKPGDIETRAGQACPACGHVFLAGEGGHDNVTRGSVTFNDAYSMRGPPTDPICSACATVFSSSFLPAYPAGVACADGFFPFSSNAHRSWFLLNPPDGPFVMASRLAKQQHLFWRTPVALSRDIYPIRVGTHVGIIRRQLLQRVSEMSADVLAAAAAFDAESAPRSKRGRAPTPGAISSVHPYTRLDRDMESWRHGELKASVARYLASGKAPRDAHQLGELNALELWALSNIANTKPKDVLTERPPVYQPPLLSGQEPLDD
jgi:CRISPR type IV-associated protein Csf1